MRAHAKVEDTIARLKDSGLKHMPFSDFDANSARTQLVALSHTLVRWFQQLRLAGTQLADAAPKRLRWQLWHAPARLVRSARRWTKLGSRLTSSSVTTRCCQSRHLNSTIRLALPPTATTNAVSCRRPRECPASSAPPGTSMKAKANRP
ncbi:MAG: hypothetical protein F4110_00655 [Acidimicrobiaceae bacterium]|nr:hypothetical protein [Acidimicrobiaceae bacterium]MXZ98348.1 hypothetical protein [Acidimicrobiaceae bacterium]MYE75461.1 hypothetical protein [Acidimicrobiaceae bacterium]MYE97350.1 hypothetical protein [Acidimicrobiaceae bacterium]MYH45012.1 hypothetical protein [Acidimicrobiaceae bacterium]